MTRMLLSVWMGALLLAAPARAADRVEVKLERLKAKTAWLQAPEGVTGDFDVAKIPPQVDFAVFPGQFDGARLWSAWGESLTASSGRFYASIGDHDAPHGTAFVYEVDPVKRRVRQVVRYNEVVPRKKESYSPGKIHGAVVEGTDGWLYFFGYRGSVRQTTKAADYQGDWLLRYDPKSGKAENLGIAVPYSSVPVLAALPMQPALYGLSVPGQTMPDPATQFFHYDFGQRKIVFKAAITSRGPRAMVVDDRGRAWFSVEGKDQKRNHLARYDPKTQKIEPVDLRVPGDTMLRAATRVDKQGRAWCFSRDGIIFSLDTRRDKIRQVGQAFVSGPQYIASCRLDPTERYVYYVPGAHGRSGQAGTPLIQFDTRSGRRKVLAFLNAPVRKLKNYNLGGTYGLVLSGDGSQVFVNFNGARLPAGRQSEFGLCSALLVHVPAGER